ncbi:MAG: hypothetical protein CBD18_03595 [Opitutales bacterium TMED158]|nr:MAG: hypothetical protein CBD18_03595 [Opitutales bacterium TMED158]
MNPWTYSPALDIGHSYTKRLESRDRESGLIEMILHQCVYRAIRFYLRKRHRLEIIHPERVPESGPRIIVTNHTSHLDALVLGSFLPKGFRDTASPLAAGDVFFSSPIRSLFSAFFLNALPLRRNAYHGAALKALRQRLIGSSMILYLFPEGTRSRSGEMAPFKQGIGTLVAETEIQVVPCWIEGAHHAWPPSRKWPSRGALSLHTGQAIAFKDVANDRQGWRQIASTLQDAVGRLNPNNGQPEANADRPKEAHDAA